MNHSEYFCAFFQELSKQVSYGGYGHAITCEDGFVCVLLGIGDARVKIQLQKLDADPKQAVRFIAARWQEIRQAAYIDDYVDSP